MALPPVEDWADFNDDPRGADPLQFNVNAPYDKGDLCWLLVSTALCWQITPAIGLLYAGMSPRKSALTMIFQSFFCACAVGIQFWIYGYSLYMTPHPSASTTATPPSANPIIGTLSKAALVDVLARPSIASGDIPDIIYAAFGVTFVTATAMIMAGAVLSRGRLGPGMLFILCWTTFVYYFLAYWEWNPEGWLAKLGVMDFAGSGPVHIASGFGALAWSLMIGVRKGDHDHNYDHDHDLDGAKKTRQWWKKLGGGKRPPHTKPHNPYLVAIGTMFIWFGWLAFNGASTANLTLRSIYAVLNTNMAACAGGVVWPILEYFLPSYPSPKGTRATKKFSILGICSGVISGLVGITPAAGFVPIYTAPVVGGVTSFVCFFCARYSFLLTDVDEGLDIWAIHGMGGIVGDILTGIFAAPWVVALDGASGGEDASPGGWWVGNWKQMGYQIAAAVTCAAWSFGVSCVLLFLIGMVPGMGLRVDEETERRGMDSYYFADCEDVEGRDEYHEGVTTGVVVPVMSGLGGRGDVESGKKAE